VAALKPLKFFIFMEVDLGLSLLKQFSVSILLMRSASFSSGHFNAVLQHMLITLFQKGNCFGKSSDWFNDKPANSAAAGED